MSTFVSVIIPIRNEERYIKKCAESLIKQDYPKENMEILFIDGASEDNTVNILEPYLENNYMKVYNNPNKTVPYAMNIGIKGSKGKYIIRLDAHSVYPIDYISKCVYYLDNTDADNVGGRAIATSEGYFGSAVSYMLSSKFGVGNSRFRTSEKSGYVDTVPFGAFRRETFEKYGYYDERLTRNQDIELNNRIVKNGGKVYLASDITLSYHNRDSFKGLANQAFNDGKWNVITFFLCKNTMSLRHFIPFAFLLSLIIMPLIIITTELFILKLLFLIELVLYILLDLIFSIRICFKKGFKYLPLLFILFPFYHITYGVGSLIGLIFFLLRGGKI